MSAKKYTEVIDFNKRSVSEMHGEEIVVRAPDKMIDFLQNNILLAFRDLLIYCNVEKYHIDDPENAPKNPNEDSHFVDIEIKQDQLTYL